MNKFKTLILSAIAATVSFGASSLQAEFDDHQLGELTEFLEKQKTSVQTKGAPGQLTIQW